MQKVDCDDVLVPRTAGRTFTWQRHMHGKTRSGPRISCAGQVERIDARTGNAGEFFEIGLRGRCCPAKFACSGDQGRQQTALAGEVSLGFFEKPEQAVRVRREPQLWEGRGLWKKQMSPD